MRNALQLVKTARRLRRQKGFTLLELLVVVAILAAIAGTATIALQDTDARASAAAHVAMMDELNKGIRTFRVLNNNAYPDVYDSLLEAATGGQGTPGAAAGAGTTGTAFAGTAAGQTIIEAAGDLDIFALSAEALGILNDIGITTVQVAYLDNDPADDGTCADMQALINSRGNAVVAGNLFLTPDANGCGNAHTLAAGSNVAIWTGGNERVNGISPAASTLPDAPVLTAGAFTGGDGATVYMAVGLGPSSTLFNVANLGGMTTVPVYRHVADDQYNRFIALFDIGTVDIAGGGADGLAERDQVLLQAIIDGAGDTKEEELGEWDGTRNTI